jgi:hypothetical protein
MMLATCRAADTVRGRYPRTLAPPSGASPNATATTIVPRRDFFRTRRINRGLARSSSRKPDWFCREEAVSCRSRNGQLNGNVEAKSC